MMKKGCIGLIIAGLIGACPTGIYAASDLHIQPSKILGVLQQDYKRDKEPKKEQGRDQSHQDWEHEEKEHKDHERKDDERKEQERRDREHKDRDQRETDHREEHRDYHHREYERWTEEQRERERREQALRIQEREDARYVIHRTAPVIFAAQRAADHRHYYSGLALAVTHQQKARELYMAGFYREAIFHSLRARKIAIMIIEGNRERWSYSRDDREDRYWCNAPKDNDLDLRLNLIKVRDHEAIRISINLDLN